jgi:hypothetical protein
MNGKGDLCHLKTNFTKIYNDHHKKGRYISEEQKPISEREFAKEKMRIITVPLDIQKIYPLIIKHIDTLPLSSFKDLSDVNLQQVNITSLMVKKKQKDKRI